VCEHKLAHRSHTTSDKTRKANPALEKKDEGKGVHKVKRVDAAHIERVWVGRKQGAGGRAQKAESVNTLVRTQVCVCVCLPPHTHSHWACRASSARVITALALRVKQRTEQKHDAKEDKANIVTAWWVGGEVVCVRVAWETPTHHAAGVVTKIVGSSTLGAIVVVVEFILLSSHPRVLAGGRVHTAQSRLMVTHSPLATLARHGLCRGWFPSAHFLEPREREKVATCGG
jgi:hypothetical protein